MANAKKTTEKKPTVITVKADDINPNGIGAVGRTNAQATRKVKTSGNNAWALTCLWLHGIKPLETYDIQKDVKDIAEDIRNTFKDSFLNDYDDFPVEGRNARTGKMMDVSDKNGDPKWSSWEETRVPISYCGDLAQVVKAELVGDLIVSETKVIGKSDILNKAKGSTTPLKTIEQSLLLIGKKFGELSLTDMETALSMIDNARKANAAQQADSKEAIAKASK